MLLYFLRHAEAVPHRADDAGRELTPHGLEQAKCVGEFCRKHDLKPDLILSSPYVRAQQTARAFAKEIGSEVTLADFLISGMKPSTACSELKNYTEFNSVMIVGHEPDFSRLAASLLGLPSHEQIHLRKSSLTLLDVNALRPGTATLEFSLPVKFL